MSTEPRQSRRQQSHQRILDAAAGAVRRLGYAGVGVAEVMKEAGLTHGGFYAHFESRDALLAEAVEHAGIQSGAALRARMRGRVDGGASALRALIEEYLSELHMDATALGCPVAALGSEMPRLQAALREAACRRVQALVALVEQSLPPGVDHGRAAVIAAAMVGALQMARVLGKEHGGGALLKNCREALIAEYHYAGATA
jgi:TetR/AcrR family transcriptional repressor of nem operon